MFRRNFIGRIALTSVVGGSAFGANNNVKKERITFKVRGFTCPTCAVGLDTILGKKEGVIQTTSNYADATTIVEFDSALINERTLQASIAELGFTATRLLTR